MITLTIPLRLPSAANLREHPMARHRRIKAQRQTVAWMLGFVLVEMIAFHLLSRFMNI